MWFKIIDSHVEIAIYAKPNAKKTQLIAITDDRLHIALHAKPHEGEANKELLFLISQFFKIPKTQIDLIKGKNSRHKLIRLPLSESVICFLNNPKIQEMSP
ncbi:TPA: DUF167 domain-containing protein [Legionella pneumophila]|uniref:UPF0235 protein I8Y58_002084 n=1 Tax=Legionella pneumophila TaxID=446 RepID=A0AAN5KS31_LEGPN|nr:DUF167 domain-containing protein [Legionella pneumophila subsp. fraseri]HAT1596852.1 DUF167 domain-containing protein [Legionella pneumophila]MDX1847254.1 DUF167 domain-containing protein [Legionella pneumophila subsp. fraseri]HAT1773126.1 DUF167 domain-containing protein [Legionella pneumophila]HAT1972945.1 DUF167 domain-containing protein [Legionella pneumophila]